MRLIKCFLPLLLVVAASEVLCQSGDEPKVDEETTNPLDERLEKLKTAGISLAKVFAAAIGVANPILGAGLAIGIEVIERIIEAIEGKQDVWDQIEAKVDLRIGEKLAVHEISEYKDLLFDFNRRMGNGDRFEVADLNFIIGKMEAVIPFSTAVGWNYQLPLMMVAYLPYLIAGYQEILKKDKKLPECQLANDMNLFRSKVILGCKEMVKKRYKAILFETWSQSQQKNCKRKRRRHKSSLSKKLYILSPVKCTMYQQIYKDNVNGKVYKVAKFNGKADSPDWQSVINNNVRRQVVDFLYSEVVQKINKYFIPELCMTEEFNCKCPKPITRSEIDFSWPSKCYGNSACVAPAGKFGKSYVWCYEKGWFKSWMYVDQEVDLDTCMPVERHGVKPLNILDSKKKD